MTGVFINFQLEYKQTVNGTEIGHDNNKQAEIILQKGKSLIDAGYTGVAITYSANEGQTDALAKAYSNDQYSAAISGDNQAQVMRRMEVFLGTSAWSELQMKMRIAPITTIPNDESKWLEVVKKDIENIATYLEKNWAILGWINQDCDDTDHRYAIGGGVQSNIPSEIETEIQNSLKLFAEKYPQ